MVAIARASSAVCMLVHKMVVETSMADELSLRSALVGLGVEKVFKMTKTSAELPVA